MLNVPLGLMLLLAVPTAASAKTAPVLKPVGEPFEVSGDFFGKARKKVEAAEDISGIACLPDVGAGPRRCMVVNDQNRNAQLVQIEGRTLVPGDTVELIGKSSSGKTLGAEPDLECSKGTAGFNDLDGEGVASSGSFYYVVGSHGCTRWKRQFQLSSFILARVPVGGEGKPVGEVETTYRLADALGLAPAVKRFVGSDLMNGRNGLNVEGLAIIGDRLFAGLRAPSLDGSAYIVSASVSELFAPGHARLQTVPEVVPLALGHGAGIRDLAPLPDGRLLVLSGPAQEQGEVPYALFAAEPRAGGALKLIGVLEALPEKDEHGRQRGKAEAVTLLGPDRVLILFDSLPNGGPREYRISPD